MLGVPPLGVYNQNTEGWRFSTSMCENISQKVSYTATSYYWPSTGNRIYTPHDTLVHIFAKYWPIFTILSPTYSVGNVQ